MHPAERRRKEQAFIGMRSLESFMLFGTHLPTSDGGWTHWSIPREPMAFSARGKVQGDSNSICIYLGKQLKSN
jgi:hypothetical protein